MVTVHLFIVYCLALNQYICRTYELAPSDGHRITSTAECMRGGMMSAAEFEFEGAKWFIKGSACREEADPVGQAISRIEKRIDP